VPTPVAPLPSLALHAEPFAADVLARALDARDARFDGVFFVGITSTRIYCRPVCPARVSYPDRRRFFLSAAAAERAGYRPCLRCRPELAPGCSPVDAVARLAHDAARHIAAGALNDRPVTDLARTLGVSARHLRRAMRRALGVSPVELAQTHRLLLAKRLLVDTALPVTQVAYASGFRSLRRFNATFHARYRMPPGALRRAPRANGLTPRADTDAPPPLRLTLAYRAPFAWDALLAALRADVVDGVDVVEARHYGRTIELDGHRGVVFVQDVPRKSHVAVDVSPSLAPALMPLLARLRRLLDLDAEPATIDAHLAAGGLAAHVAARPGLRAPGAVDGFEVALRAILRGRARDVVEALGEPLATRHPALRRLTPDAHRVASAGAVRLTALGVPNGRATALVGVARLVADGALRLEPGSPPAATRRTLVSIPGVGERVATLIVARALAWPDVCPDRTLLDAVERCRPWRAYAALHLRLAAHTTPRLSRAG